MIVAVAVLGREASCPLLAGYARRYALPTRSHSPGTSARRTIRSTCARSACPKATAQTCGFTSLSMRLSTTSKRRVRSSDSSAPRTRRSVLTLASSAFCGSVDSAAGCRLERQRWSQARHVSWNAVPDRGLQSVSALPAGRAAPPAQAEPAAARDSHHAPRPRHCGSV